MRLSAHEAVIEGERGTACGSGTNLPANHHHWHGGEQDQDQCRRQRRQRRQCQRRLHIRCWRRDCWTGLLCQTIIIFITIIIITISFVIILFIIIIIIMSVKSGRVEGDKRQGTGHDRVLAESYPASSSHDKHFQLDAWKRGYREESWFLDGYFWEISVFFQKMQNYFVPGGSVMKITGPTMVRTGFHWEDGNIIWSDPQIRRTHLRPTILDRSMNRRNVRVALCSKASGLEREIKNGVCLKAHWPADSFLQRRDCLRDAAQCGLPQGKMHYKPKIIHNQRV